MESDKKYLFEKGWHTLWNDDNWVHPVIMRGSNMDYCGVGIEAALSIQKKVDNGTYGNT